MTLRHGGFLDVPDLSVEQPFLVVVSQANELIALFGPAFLALELGSELSIETLPGFVETHEDLVAGHDFPVVFVVGELPEANHTAFAVGADG